MTKYILSLIIVFAFFTSYGQLKIAKGVKLYPHKNKTSFVAEPAKKVTDEIPFKQQTLPSAVNKAVPATNKFTSATSTLSEAIIGQTIFDFQTHASMPQRIVNNGNGTLSAAWNFIPVGGFNLDRGTGYNYFDGSNWMPWPVSRIENTRTGFTNLNAENGVEYVLNHTSTNGLAYTTRTLGTGSWTTNSPVGTINLFPNQFDVWCHSAVGGANGTSIHVIVNSQGTFTSPVLGQHGPLTYSRSTDGGLTWGIDHIQLPGSDSTFFTGFGAENYHIDSRGDVVAIVAGGYLSDFVLWKSVDNGTTWTKTTLYQFPYPLFTTGLIDINADGIPDSVESVAMDGTVSIDNNGICHVAVGRFVVSSDTNGIPLVDFLSDGLYYWNESLPLPMTIVAATEDITANGFIDFPIPVFPNGVPVSLYNLVGLQMQPSIGFDDSNDVYLAYSTITEATDTTVYRCMYRHVTATRSSDMGLTWGLPEDLVPSIAQGGNGEFQEGVFGSIARKVDGSGINSQAYIVYQRDFAPSSTGGYLNGTPPPGINPQPYWNADSTTLITYTNDIICVTITGLRMAVTGISETENITKGEISIFPNPANEYVMCSLPFSMNEQIELRVFDLTGKELFIDIISTPHDGSEYKLKTTGFSKGAYFVEAKGEKTFTRGRFVKQ